MQVERRTLRSRSWKSDIKKWVAKFPSEWKDYVLTRLEEFEELWKEGGEFIERDNDFIVEWIFKDEWGRYAEVTKDCHLVIEVEKDYEELFAHYWEVPRFRTVYKVYFYFKLR
jgi:hypothetical protein